MSSIRLLVAFSILLGAALPADAQHSGIAPSGKKGTVHVVQSGDTLWDLSARYMDNPYLWPQLWDNNKHIVANNTPPSSPPSSRKGAINGF